MKPFNHIVFNSTICRIAISALSIVSTAALAFDGAKLQQATDLRDKVMTYQDKKLAQCISASPLVSDAKKCQKESNVHQVQDSAMHSARNCEAYYRRGSDELSDCKIFVYQSALDAMDNRMPYKGWQAPDGSSKPDPKNTSIKL